MLRKTCVTGGLVIAAAAGTLVTGSAASAQPMGGWGHFRHHFRFFSGHRAWNGNENLTRNHIRIRIRNRNNNVAVARNEQAQRERQRQFQFERERRRARRIVPPPGVTITPAQCMAGGGTVVGTPPNRFCSGGVFNGFPVVP